MRDRPYNVLFLCTHNSARSIIAECVMNKLGAGKFKGLQRRQSAERQGPPLCARAAAAAQLRHQRVALQVVGRVCPTRRPALDFVFTVCDDAANEVCPVWPGQPMSAHWGVPDPSRAEGTEAERRYAFADTHRMLNQRIGIFTNLPLRSLDSLSLQRRLDDIGRTKLEKE